MKVFEKRTQGVKCKLLCGTVGSVFKKLSVSYGHDYKVDYYSELDEKEFQMKLKQISKAENHEIDAFCQNHSWFGNLVDKFPQEVDSDDSILLRSKTGDTNAFIYLQDRCVPYYVSTLSDSKWFIQKASKRAGHSETKTDEKAKDVLKPHELALNPKP